MNKTQIFRHLRSSGLLSRGTKTLTNKKLESDSEADWNEVIKDAEKVVGYPTSFLNLRWLLNDEVANIATHMRKLIQTEHPLLKSVKDYLFTNETPAWGLIILLISKTAGLKSNVAEVELDRVAGILHSQRVLAEVTEMIRTSVLIHKNVLNIYPSKMENLPALHYGNKIALLSGDYLLGRSFKDLASLKNSTANEIISSAMRDLSECEFLGVRDSQNQPIPSKPREYQETNDCSSKMFSQNKALKIISEDDYNEGPYNIKEILGYPREEWVLRNILHGANLLGKACKASMVFGGHDENAQKQAYLLGKNTGLAWQAKIDYSKFLSEDTFNLTSAPVMLHLNKDHGLYKLIEIGFDDVTKCDFRAIKERVMSGTAMDDTISLKQEFIRRALVNAKYFDDNVARKGLENLIKNI